MLTPTYFKIGFWNAWIFMIVFIFQMIVMFFAGKDIMKRSHVLNNIRRTPFERNISLIANFVWLLSMVYSIFLQLRLGTTWFWIGFSVFIIGLTILGLATIAFITTPIDQLIQKGVYRFSRHPMYLSTLLICLGTSIATTSWIFILLSFVIFICFHYEAIVEEKCCHNDYKDLYKEYQRRVPMWIGIPRQDLK